MFSKLAQNSIKAMF
ncbi:hypothetical protein IB351_003468 [Escherichia coli]|nr:hypothetical protein [Escherichia coli]EHK7386044.1 hypothetical protein [Escherichia coli]EHK7523162.1 hypothetical protein [Escherichia coli]EHT4079233.1 hypothetical protein [Escherichia coli]MCN5901887.1 hypothetical protein [Escherichia coli]